MSLRKPITFAGLVLALAAWSMASMPRAHAEMSLRPKNPGVSHGESNATERSRAVHPRGRLGLAKLKRLFGRWGVPRRRAPKKASASAPAAATEVLSRRARAFGIALTCTLAAFTAESAALALTAAEVIDVQHLAVVVADVGRTQAKYLGAFLSLPSATLAAVVGSSLLDKRFR